MGNWESHLYTVPAHKLDGRIRDSLRPSEDCQKHIDSTVNTLCAALQEDEPLSLEKSVAKGGSYGRKTVLRGNSDGTLVIFVSKLEKFQDQKKSQQEIFKKIWECLRACQFTGLEAKVQIQRHNSGLTIHVSSGWQSITFEVLPAFNALGLSENPSPWVYRELKRSLDMTNARPGDFSVCFTELQQKFFDDRPRKLKDLILLVKHWHLQYVIKQDSFPLVPSYALELLTVYAWEQGCGAEDFDIAEGIRTVLGLIMQQKKLCVYWTVNYNFEDETVRNVLLSQLRSPRPVILDPTDPTNNVSKDDVYWQQLKKEAECWLSSSGLNESPGPSWNVLLAEAAHSPRLAAASSILQGRSAVPSLRLPPASLSITGTLLPLSLSSLVLTLAHLDHPGYSPRLKSLNSSTSAKFHSSYKPAPLFTTPGHLLDTFITDFLQPSRIFLDQIKKAVDIICTFLKEKCFQHSTTKVLKVVKGGSTAKGTALKSGSDADIIVFLNSFKNYASQKTERCNIIKEIHKQLEACQQEKEFEVKFEISKWKPPRVLSFSLKSKVLSESVDFNVLPAFDALGQLNSGSAPSPSVYAELIHLYKSSDAVGGEFSTCFTELQRNFVESRPTKVKSLICLVKHWYKQCEKKLKQKGSLPPKYALELLTIYAWEQGSRVPNFDTAEGFRTVLELVTKYQQLCVLWTVNYNFEDETTRNFLLTQMQKTRPVILDPAEPTGDVGGGDRWCWHLLAKEATEWLSALCFKDGNGHPVQSWKVPVRII